MAWKGGIWEGGRKDWGLGEGDRLESDEERRRREEWGERWCGVVVMAIYTRYIDTTQLK